VRICDLLLGPQLGRARWADRLNEAAGRLGAKLAARWEVDAELEELQTSATRIWDLVMDNIGEPSSLVASLSTVVELLWGRINTATANGVRWGTRSVLVAALSHFSELKSELELLRSRHNANQTDDQADALWTWVHAASDLLASHVPPSVTCSPPDNAGE
jgi:hypothetical protein